MAEDLGARAAGLLVDEAWAEYRRGHYQQTLAAAGRAVEAAGQLDDPVLLVRALAVQASALRMTGDFAAALARYSRIMALAEDPLTSSRLDNSYAAAGIAAGYWGWVQSALFVTGIPVRELFGVLDAADRWLAATGHRDWRASVLYQRGLVHHRLDEKEAAVAAAEEALAVAIQHPGSPGYTPNGIRCGLGDCLRSAGRPAEAAPHYQAVLDDSYATPGERFNAYRGLAGCALAAGDPGAARREGRIALLLAEPLGDDALCLSLDVLTEACRADGDLDDAWQAATRYLEAAGRIGGHNRPYHAVRKAVDVALDRADLAAAGRLQEELEEHTAALGADTGTTVYASETAKRRQRLGELTAARSQQPKADQ